MRMNVIPQKSTLEYRSFTDAVCRQELFDEESGLLYDGPYDEHAVGRARSTYASSNGERTSAECLFRLATIVSRKICMN